MHLVELVAVNAKIGPASGGTDQHQSVTTMIAVSYASSYVRLMGFTEDGSNRIEVGTFSLGVSIDKLFFIGNQVWPTLMQLFFSRSFWILDRFNVNQCIFFENFRQIF